MAIQPIDLQTLFTQMDKVGKVQTAEKEGLAIQQAIAGTQLEKKNEQQIRAVNKPQETGDGVDKVNDHHEQKHQKKENREKEAEEEIAVERKSDYFKDPALGRNIDISL
jgi:hypothetical protein